MKKEHCFAFDGTILEYPYEYTREIEFINKNIGGINDDKHSNLSFFTEKYSAIMLKMDIEGGEYPWLLHMDETGLDKFKQIVIEFHGITDHGWGCVYSDKVKCLEKLSRTHYLVHAHGNNHGPVVNKNPHVIELTYVNKKQFANVPVLNTQKLPIQNIDFPNKAECEDIDLQFQPFVNKSFYLWNVFS